MYRYAALISSRNLSIHNVSKLDSRLTGLYMSGIRLKILPSFLFSHLPNLVWLDVRDNRIIDIPSDITKLQKLKVRIKY